MYGPLSFRHTIHFYDASRRTADPGFGFRGRSPFPAAAFSFSGTAHPDRETLHTRKGRNAVRSTDKAPETRALHSGEDRRRLRAAGRFTTNRHPRAAACGAHAYSGTNCGPPLGRGCGPPGPDGPILTQSELAAERMGLLSSSARLQPSARGRLQAAASCGRKFRIQNSKFKMTRIYPASSGRGLRRAHTNRRKGGRELRVFARRSCGPPSLRDKQTPSGCSLRSARRFGYELRASAAGGCGPLGPIGPILTQNQPAAERTGLLSSSARLQPSAQGRLRPARS